MIVAGKQFEKIAIIGLGLIGSSLCHAIRRGGLAGQIHGSARTQQTRETALRLGLVDKVSEEAAEAVEDADLVILCVPVGVCGALARQIASSLKAGAILTDVGSVKRSVIEQIRPYVPENVHFVPGHPIAGTEFSGPESGFAELFDGQWCLLTPEEETDTGAVEKLTRFWEACGARVETMEAGHHDRVLAVTSHLPHLIAFNIVGTAANLEEVTQGEVIKFAAGGFRDFTRIAASDPVMWRDIFLHNQDALLEMLGRLNEDIAVLTRAIRDGEGDKMYEIIEKTRAIRRGIVQFETKAVSGGEKDRKGRRDEG